MGAEHRPPSRLHDLARRAAKATPDLARLRGGAIHAALAVTAGLAAYLPARALGLHEGFWGAITAVAVVQTELEGLRNTARDQAVGALIGGGVGGGVAGMLGVGVATYALAVALAILLAWAANVASAARLPAITATIILLVPHTGGVREMVLARVAEVGWGVAVGLAVVWPVVAWRNAERRI